MSGLQKRIDEAVDFTGKRALVTGGTRGLGREIALALLERGATVTVCARSEPTTTISAAGADADFIAADVRDPESVGAVVAAAVEAMGGLDILINNAGGAPAAAAKDSGGSFNTKVVELNLLGPMNMSIAAYAALDSAPDGGVIINISSVSGMRANPMGVAYGAAKAGLINMSKTLAVEWGPQIRVLTLSAGPLSTEASEAYLGEAEMARMAQAMATRRLGSSADIVNAVLFAASPLAAWMTGSNFVVDGGPEWPGNGYPRPAATDSEGLRQ